MFSSFVQVNIEPQNDIDAVMPEQIEPAISSNESDRFCNETKPYYEVTDEISDCDDALIEETFDNDSDPSFKSGSEHVESSEYLFSNARAYIHLEIIKFQLGDNEDDGDDDDEDIDNDEDDSDDFTLAKLYQKKQKLPGQPKRGRGRPKKIRDPAEEQDRANWRNRKIHKCPHCIKKFTRRSHVTVHVRKRHGFECSICNTRWGRKIELTCLLSFLTHAFCLLNFIPQTSIRPEVETASEYSRRWFRDEITSKIR